MKKSILFMFVFSVALIVATGCSTIAELPETSTAPKVEAAASSDAVKPSAAQPSTPSSRIALSWELTTAPHPERKPWSDFLTAHMKSNLKIYETAKDVQVFCPKFSKLNEDQKTKALSELVVGMIYFESGYKPTSYMVETTMSVDKVTGVQVKSEGLLQLSYQDIPNYGALLKGCGIDWAKDKGLAQTDPKKTIFNPIINLNCGLLILTNQVKNKQAIALEKGVYWAVIKLNGKYTKINQIAERVQKNAPFCK